MSFKQRVKDRRLESWPLSRLRPCPDHDPRRYDPELPENSQLAESIRRFGIRQPIIVTGDGEIIDGHRRYTAAQLVRREEVPVFVYGSITKKDADIIYRELHYWNIGDEEAEEKAEIEREEREALMKHLEESSDDEGLRVWPG